MKWLFPMVYQIKLSYTNLLFIIRVTTICSTFQLHNIHIFCMREITRFKIICTVILQHILKFSIMLFSLARQDLVRNAALDQDATDGLLHISCFTNRHHTLKIDKVTWLLLEKNHKVTHQQTYGPWIAVCFEWNAFRDTEQWCVVRGDRWGILDLHRFPNTLHILMMIFLGFLVIYIFEFAKVLLQMPFLMQPSPFIWGWDWHRSTLYVVPCGWVNFDTMIHIFKMLKFPFQWRTFFFSD